MGNPFLAMIVPMGDGAGIGGGQPPYPSQGLPPFATQLPIIIPGAPPGSPGSPSHPIYLPVYPDQGLPGGQGGRPSQPIYHPGHPDHGLPPYPSHPIAPGGPSGGYPSQPIYHPGHPDHGLPAFPSHPIELPPGGTPIDPPTEIPPPPGHEDELVVGVYKPGQGWEFKAYDVAPDQGQPAPSPHG